MHPLPSQVEMGYGHLLLLSCFTCILSCLGVEGQEWGFARAAGVVQTQVVVLPHLSLLYGWQAWHLDSLKIALQLMFSSPIKAQVPVHCG